MDTVFCRNCRYMGEPRFASSGADLTKCHRRGGPKEGISPVTGEPYREHDDVYAELERLSADPERCGKSARFFAPRLQVA